MIKRKSIINFKDLYLSGDIETTDINNFKSVIKIRKNKFFSSSIDYQSMTKFVSNNIQNLLNKLGKEDFIINDNSYWIITNGTLDGIIYSHNNTSIELINNRKNKDIDSGIFYQDCIDLILN